MSAQGFCFHSSYLTKKKLPIYGSYKDKNFIGGENFSNQPAAERLLRKTLEFFLMVKHENNGNFNFQISFPRF